MIHPRHHERYAEGTTPVAPSAAHTARPIPQARYTRSVGSVSRPDEWGRATTERPGARLAGLGQDSGEMHRILFPLVIGAAVGLLAKTMA